MDFYSQQGKHIRVPGEILEQLFSYLSPTDIKAIRQVCRPFCRYSSQFLIDTVIAGSQTKTLERFEEISKHNDFHNNITTVIFSTLSFRCDYATVDQYYEDLVSRTRWVQAKLPTKTQCIPFWRSYQEVYKDQREIQWNGDDETRIVNAIHRMPNIKHLQLSGSTWKSSAHPLRSHWDAGDNVIITPTSDPLYGPWQLTHGLEVMSIALATHRMWPESLMQTGLRYRSEVIREPCFSDIVRHMFRSLRKICLYFNERSLVWHNKVESCLLAAEDLEHLELGVELLFREPVLPNIFVNTWPNLSYVALSLDLEYELFVEFCWRHRRTLRSLRLSCSCLFGGSWGQLVDVMRDWLQLTYVYLEGLSEDSRRGYAWEKGHRLPEAEDYLLHGGENPFRGGILHLERLY